MMSLDLKNLCASFPKTQISLNILKDKLTDNGGFNNKEINEIIHPINVIINQNY